MDENRGEIIRCGEYVLSIPSLATKEFKTSQFVKTEFKKLSIPYTDGLAVTGVKGCISSGAPVPTMCIIGEMDAIRCYGHKCRPRHRRGSCLRT